MALDRRKRSVYNIVSSFIGQIISICLGLVIPRLFLLSFGSEVNGLLTSCNQIYTYLALMEAGVGTATLQALYKPVAQQDKNSISGILSATNSFYKKTGRMYLIGVLLLSFLYPLFVPNNIGYITIVLVFLLNGIPGVVNFYFQGKFTILLQAEGKQYILTNLTTIITICVNIAKIILMSMGFNIVVLQVSYMLFNLLKMIFIVVYIKRKYKWLDLSVDPDFDAISQKNSVLVQQICDLVFRNTDVLILTIFCDLKVVSIYSIYTMFFSIISTLLDNFTQGFSFALGQIFNINRERYIELRDIYETYRMTVVFALYSIADTFILPFMKLYTEGVNDINYIDFWLPELFIATYLLSCGRANCAADINYAQHFKKTQWRSVLEAIINLVVSVVCVSIWGIYGVLFGTIAALLYRTNDMIIYANVKILKRTPWRTYKRWIINFILYVGIKIILSNIPLVFDNYLSIIGVAAIVGVIILVIFFAINSIFDWKSFRGAIEYIKNSRIS